MQQDRDDPLSALGEHDLHAAVELLVHLVEAAGALIVFVGVVIAFARFFVGVLIHRERAKFSELRVDFGHFLLLGLDFQLAADVLETTVAPTFEQIGKLAAIATIRTALNYFLTREIREAAQETTERDEPAP